MNTERYHYEQRADYRQEYFRIGVTRSGVHFHRSIEIVYCISGKKDVYIDGVHYLLDEGELLFVPPFTVHFYPEIENQKSLCVILPVTYSEIYNTYIGSMQFESPVFTDKELAKDIFEQLMKLEYTKNTLLRDGIYRYVLGTILDRGMLIPKKDTRKDGFTFSVLTYFEDHYREKLSLEKVATALGYSRCHFSSLFKKELKIGFSEYLSILRIEKSLALIGKLPVNEVAFKVGFGSLQSFYTNFKRIVGVSPSVYLGSK